MKNILVVIFVSLGLCANAQITKEQLCLCAADELLVMNSIAPLKWECVNKSTITSPLTTIGYDPNTKQIAYVDENAATTTLDLSALSQTLNLVGNQLTISGENTITLPSGGGCSTYFVGDAGIKATGPGVTYALAGNVGTVTVPNGVELCYVRVNATTASLGGQQDFTLKIVDLNAVANQGTFGTFMPPTTEFIERSVNQASIDPPTTALPFKYTVDAPPTPQVQITGYGANAIDITFKNIASYALWSVVASF